MAVIVWFERPHEGAMIRSPVAAYKTRAEYEADALRISEIDKAERYGEMVILDADTLETHEWDGWRPVEVGA